MNRKGLCLAEFLIALGLLAGMAITASAVSVYVANTGAKIDKTILPITQANLAAEAIVQRLKRTPVGANQSCYTITNGNSIQYKSVDGKRTEEFAFKNNQIIYRQDVKSNAYDVVLNGVDSVSFNNDVGKRVAVQITMMAPDPNKPTEKPSVRTSVFPVNTFTTRGAIN